MSLQNLKTANDLSRALFDLSKIYRYEHAVKLEYSSKSNKDFAERMIITLDNEDDDHHHAFTCTITEYESKAGTKGKPIEITLEIEDEEDGEDDWDFHTFDQTFEYIKKALEPKKAKPEVPALASESPFAMKLNIIDVNLNGRHTTQVARLDVNCPSITGHREPLTRQVPLAYVGNTLHIADIDLFLTTIGFYDFIPNTTVFAKHHVQAKILNGLENALQHRTMVEIVAQGKLVEESTVLGITFLLEIKGARIHGFIPTTIEDFDEIEEEAAE